MQKVRLLGLIFLGILGALFFSEIILRLLYHPPFLDPRLRRDDLVWMKTNVKLNQFGYRDNDVSLIKPSDTLRIYSLGDSYTFGWYINDGNLTYPNLLEEKLKSGGPIKVINASQPGFNLENSLDRYRTEGMLFAPDIVTLGINIFDLAEKEFAPQPNKFKIFESSRLYQLTFGNMQRDKVAQKTKRELKKASLLNSSQFKKATEIILKLNQLVLQNGGKLVLIVFPNYDPGNPNGSYEFFDYHQNLKKFTSQEKIMLVDLYQKYNTVKDKRELVLNPLDGHPSITAHRLAADELFEKLKKDFKKDRTQLVKQQIKRGFFGIGDSIEGLHSIISISSPNENWVYFDRINGLGIQKNILTDSKDRQTGFMTDYLKTAKAFTHEGWVGSQIEANFLGPTKQIVVSEKFYGFKIVGIHQIIGFSRKNGSLESRDLELLETSIEKRMGEINISVLTDESFDFYRVSFDVAVNQLDIEGNTVVAAFKTEVLTNSSLEAQFNVSDQNVKLPQFVANGQSSSYVWYNKRLKKTKLKRQDNWIRVELTIPTKEGDVIEMPISKQLKMGEFGKPQIEYL